MNGQADTVLITGSSGFIGQRLMRKLAADYRVVGLDLKEGEVPEGARFVPIDLTSDDGVGKALTDIRGHEGPRIASVIHLAAYFDLSGEEDPKYDAVTVEGTRRLLRGLRAFDLGQFVFSSTMLVHEAGQPGTTISEDRPLDPKLPYRASKIRTERMIRAERGDLPAVFLRPGGVYGDRCENAFLAHQIARIFEGRLKGHMYPGDLRTGQSFLHLEDLADAVKRVVDRRDRLPPETAILLGEPEVIGYGDLQGRIGELIRGTPWQTWQIPKAIAKTGAWAEDEVLGGGPFTKPWMADIADDHYEIDISRARDLLGWEPKHRLRDALPRMIEALRDDPEGWYRANGIDPARLQRRRGPS